MTTTAQKANPRAPHKRPPKPLLQLVTPRDGGPSGTCTLTIPYDSTLLRETGWTAEEFSRHATFLLAAKLYEQGLVSSGNAAELCGVGRAEFLLKLPSVRVATSNLTVEDIDDEFGPTNS